jgi:hypothetical protein
LVGRVTRSLREKMARTDHGKEPRVVAIDQTLFDESR